MAEVMTSVRHDNPWQITTLFLLRYYAKNMLLEEEAWLDFHEAETYGLETWEALCVSYPESVVVR